jgi:hypothetical protein
MLFQSLHDKPRLLCVICGKEFSQDRFNKITCSRPCSKRHHKQYMREYARSHRKEARANNRQHYKNHPEIKRERNHKYYLLRIAADPEYYRRRYAQKHK